MIDESNQFVKLITEVIHSSSKKFNIDTAYFK